MSDGPVPEVSAMAVNVVVPEELRWHDSRRGEAYELTTINVRMLPDGRLATRAYGRPVAGGRGAYTGFPVPDRPELARLVDEAASEAGRRWSAHLGR